MANKKISELVSRTPSLTDLMLVGDPSSGYSYKCTVNDIALQVEVAVAGNYVTLGTTQTISGAKTFSNVLTLTSVANSSVDTDKFLVLTGTNTVNYRTGSQVLSDIGGQGALTLTTTGTSGAATLVGNTLNIPNYAPDLSGYVPTSRTLTINGTAYDLSANRTWSVGTVTSITGGTGLTGGTITGSGTLAFDTTWGDARYQLVLTNPVTGTGTTNYIPKFTSSNAIGNSLLYDNGTNIGIGTTSPAYKLDVLESGATTAANSFSMARITGSDAVANDLTLIGPNTSQVRIKFGDPDDATIGEVGYNHSTNAMRFNTNGAQRMIIDASGNLGLGVTPSAWTITPTLQVRRASMYNDNGDGSYYTTNAYYDGSWKYIGTGTATQYYQLTGQHIWRTAPSGIANNAITFTQSMTLDASGNLGLGVTPSAWGNLTKAIQISNTGASVWSYTSAGTGAEYLFVDNNTYNDNTNNIYIRDGAAARYRQLAGEHTWWNAPSGTAGGTVSFTQAMTLDASGRLGIGTTSPAYKLDVLGNIQASDNILIGNGSNAAYGLEVGYGRTTTGSSYVDLIGGDITYQDYGSRFTRESGGANANTGIYHRGTGLLKLSAQDAGAITFETTSSERMRITTGGNVGIGTSSPNALTGYTVLTINNNTTGSVLDLDVSDARTGSFIASSSQLNIGSITNIPFVFFTNNNERMRITANGTLTVGGSSSGTVLNGALGTFTSLANINTTSGQAGVTVFVNDGTNNRRAALFVDQDNAVWGLTSNFSSGAIPFVLINGGSERLRVTSTGSVGIGTTSLTSTSLGIAKSITGGVNAYGVLQTGSVQSDVTTNSFGFFNQLNSQSATFTLSNYTHYYADQNAIGVGNTITNQYGFRVASNMTGATNTYGFYGDIASGSNRWNIYMNGTANNYLAGNLGIGTTSVTTGNINLYVSKSLTGSVNAYSIISESQIQSDVTTHARYFRTTAGTQAATFTLGALSHYEAQQTTFGANSTVTNQYGFSVTSTLTGATNNYGFYGNIASGTGRWNLYMNGTANNYLAGNLGIGTTSPIARLNLISSTFGILHEKSLNSWFYGTGFDGNNAYLTHYTSDRMIFGYGTTTGAAPTVNTLVLTNGGNVGIGTTSPTTYTGYTTLALNNATNGGVIDFMNNGTVVGQISNTASAFSIGSTTAIPFTFVTNGSERIRITSGGNVGIGTTAPTSYSGFTTLTINNATNGGVLDLSVNNVRTGSIYTGVAGADFSINAVTSIPMLFHTNNTERMRITSGGELLINTTSDAGDYKLQVNGNSYFNGSATINATTGNNDLVFLATTRPSIFVNSTNIGLQIRTNGTGVLELNTDNSSTGDVNINNGLIYADASASSVGIGTNAPSAKLEVNGAIKTAAPSGFTAQPWKLGDVTVTSITVDTDKYISVDINGTVYNIPTCHPN